MPSGENGTTAGLAQMHSQAAAVSALVTTTMEAEAEDQGQQAEAL